MIGAPLNSHVKALTYHPTNLQQTPPPPPRPGSVLAIVNDQPSSQALATKIQMVKLFSSVLFVFFPSFQSVT